MANYSITPEFQDVPLASPEPLMLLLKGMGGGSAKGGSQTPDKRRFLPIQGVEQRQEERYWDAQFDIQVNSIVDEAIEQQRRGGMSARDYITVGPGAQKFNSFLSTYYTNMDMLAMRSQYLQDNEKYYQKFLKDEFPLVDPNEPIDINEGRTLVSRKELLGDDSEYGILPSTYQDYLVYQNQASANDKGFGGLNPGMPGALAQLTVPRYDMFNSGLATAMQEATGNLEADIITSGITGIETGIGSNGAAIVSFGKSYQVVDPNGNLYAVSLGNENALNAGFDLFMANMTPQQRRVYNKLQTGYVASKQFQAVQEAQKSKKELSEAELNVIGQAAAEEYHNNLKLAAINKKLKNGTSYESWQDLLLNFDKENKKELPFSGIVDNWTKMTEPVSTQKNIYYASDYGGKTNTQKANVLTGKLNLNTYPVIPPTALRDINRMVMETNESGNVFKLDPSVIPYIYNEYGQVFDTQDAFGLTADKISGGKPPVITNISGVLSEFINPKISDPTGIALPIRSDGLLPEQTIRDMEALWTQMEIEGYDPKTAKDKMVEPALKVTIAVDSHGGEGAWIGGGGDSQADTFAKKQFYFNQDPTVYDVSQGQTNYYVEANNQLYGGTGAGMRRFGDKTKAQYEMKEGSAMRNYFDNDYATTFDVYIPMRYLKFIDNLSFVDNAVQAELNKIATDLQLQKSGEQQRLSSSKVK